MSDPIQAAKDAIAKLESNPTIASLSDGSGWLSRKLLVALVVLAGLIWFGRDDIFKVLEISVKFAALYIIVQGVIDLSGKWADAWVQRGVNDNLVASKDLDAQYTQSIAENELAKMDLAAKIENNKAELELARQQLANQTNSKPVQVNG